MRELREVFYVHGVRTAFGRAGPKGVFWRTRADDMGVKVVRELLRRNPSLPPERIDDVVMAATAQVGDQGLTLGRDVALLAGLPQSVPGFAVDRMCAGALTAVTAGAGEIAMGAADVVLAGGIEHMGHHPLGADVDFNPRFAAERLVDTSAVTMGATAENLHDRFPHLTKDAADAYAVGSQRRGARDAADSVSRRRTRDGGELRRAHRRCDRVPALLRGRGKGVRTRASHAPRLVRVRGRRARADGPRPRPGDAEGARPGRPLARAGRALRAQRAVRGPGAELVRWPRGRSGGRAPQPVRRRDRLRSPARRDGRAPAGTARVRLPRAARDPLRAGRPLRRQ